MFNNMIKKVDLYFPHGFPRALFAKDAPANPATAPRRKLLVLLPKILLFVFWFLVPPLVQGLKIWLAIYWPATPAAAPARPASTAPLPVKNLVSGFLLLLLLLPLPPPNPNLVF